ncbi:hypothetical protein [Isoptericola dokdonensis]|uniref:Uncharacterized protein n=1 Tax=Isoptericola dokdonensis DS-3 TaxID=1300344 RepID=A0A168FJL6_9MICO|nr:hypothetical protein [Isoptericola dokdonensis]ANC31959.1 hypothetical protein I598_2422 [Isoptericola dokdonensis DS-3]
MNSEVTGNWILPIVVFAVVLAIALFSGTSVVLSMVAAAVALALTFGVVVLLDRRRTDRRAR